MLNPGGVIITPIGNHLVKATKARNSLRLPFPIYCQDKFGYTTEQKLMGVRYGELILPSRSEVRENERTMCSLARMLHVVYVEGLLALQICPPSPKLSEDYSKLFNQEFLSDVQFVGA